MSARWAAANPEKMRAARAAWKAANPERARAAIAAWKAANPERARAAIAAWAAANPERKRAATAAWAAANPERKRAARAAWKAANPGKVNAHTIFFYNKRRATKARHLALTHLQQLKDMLIMRTKLNSAKAMTTAEIWAALSACIEASARKLAEAAPLYVELQERGEDMSQFKGTIVSYLPKVYAGTLLPELLYTYAGAPWQLDCLAALVPEDQAKLAKPAARVDVLMPDGHVERLPVMGLSGTRAKQVFGDGRIRTLAEQRPHVAPAATRHGKPVWDLWRAMNNAQRQALTREAEDLGTTPTALAIQALTRSGIIPKPATVDQRRQKSPDDIHAA